MDGGFVWSSDVGPLTTPSRLYLNEQVRIGGMEGGSLRAPSQAALVPGGAMARVGHGTDPHRSGTSRSAVLDAALC